MSKQNYNKMSQTKSEVKETPAENKVTETQEFPEVVIGIVSDCLKLNIRKKPKKDSAVVLVVEKNTSLTIDEAESTKGWYSVCTSDGVKGFCMKDFVKVKF